jgi:hypothetical protein
MRSWKPGSPTPWARTSASDGMPNGRRPRVVRSPTPAAAPRGDGTRREVAGGRGGRRRRVVAERTNRTSVRPAGCRRAIGTARGSGPHDRRRPRHPVVRFSPSTGQNRTTARAAAAVVRFSRPAARQGGAGAGPRPRRAGGPGQAAQLGCTAASLGDRGEAGHAGRRGSSAAVATTVATAARRYTSGSAPAARPVCAPRRCPGSQGRSSGARPRRGKVRTYGHCVDVPALLSSMRLSNRIRLGNRG